VLGSRDWGQLIAAKSSLEENLDLLLKQAIKKKTSIVLSPSYNEPPSACCIMHYGTTSPLSASLRACPLKAEGQRSHLNSDVRTFQTVDSYLAEESHSASPCLDSCVMKGTFEYATISAHSSNVTHVPGQNALSWQLVSFILTRNQPSV
jgi:hypothetical protein